MAGIFFGPHKEVWAPRPLFWGLATDLAPGAAVHGRCLSRADLLCSSWFGDWW